MADEGQRAYEELLDSVLNNQMWGVGLVSMLTALAEELEECDLQGRTDSPPQMHFRGMVWRVSAVLERLAQRLRAQMPHMQRSGWPGSRQYLSWLTTSLAEAQEQAQQAWQFALQDNCWDEATQALRWALYSTATLTALFGTFDEAAPREMLGRGDLN